MIRKWRPSLALVLGGTLAATLAFALAGLAALRYLGPEVGFQNAAVFLATLIAALTAGLGLLMVRLLLGPIRALSGYARAVRSAPSSGLSPPNRFGTLELHSMAEAVVDMANTLKARETAIRAYSDHVTHQLKSPVSAIAAAAEMLEDSADPRSDDRQLAEQISGAAREMELHLDALRGMARAREADYFGAATLSDVIPQLCMSHSALQFEVEGIDVTFPLASDGLKLILDQLLDNAIANGANQVTLTATSAEFTTELKVSDDGCGISTGNLSRIFNPFFTTRREEGGTGMGLAIVSAILAAHKGSIQAQSSGNGAAFLIKFNDRT